MKERWLWAAGLLIAVAAAGGAGVFAGMSLTGQHETLQTSESSEYAALMDQEIRGLSAETIDGYRTGKGLGMALPAELNGYPGPRHSLEYVDEMKLTEEQHQKIQALFDEMQSQVIPLGKEILAAEIDLEEAFRNRTINSPELKAQLEKITALEARLRYLHLDTHLAMIKILTEEQVQQYNVLRGYTSSGHGDMSGHTP